MSPAPRKPANRGLERGLHTHPSGYRWKHPRTGKYHYFGKLSREEANKSARALNLHFAPKSSIFDRIVGSTESLREVIKIHLRDRLRFQKVAERTKENRGYILNKIAASHLGSLDVSSITTRDIAQYLDTLASDSMRQQYRAQLLAVFKTSIQRGIIERNPVTDTDTPRPERERARLTDEGYAAILSKAEPWLRNLMELMRLTLQRPEDLVNLKWESFDGQSLRVEQGKTGARLQIHARPELLAAIQRCRDSIASPFIIHRIPERIVARSRRSKLRQHHTQVFRGQASRAFAAIVRECDLFKGQQHPPTLYECKSLGIAQLRRIWPLADVQRLAGHRTARMTEHYAKGHEAPYEPVGRVLDGAGSVTEALLKR